MSQHRFEIEPRPATLGGGRQLRLLEQLPDGQEIEMGGGVFPVEDNGSGDAAYADALDAGEDWLRAHSDESEA